MNNNIFFTTTLCLLLNVASMAQNKKTFPSSDSINLKRQQNIDADNVLLKAFETGDVSQLDLVIDPEFLNHAGEKKGVDSLKMMIRGFHARMNNLKLELKRQLADDEYVFDWVRFINSGPDIIIEGMEVTRYANGKAIEHWFFPGGQSRRNQ